MPHYMNENGLKPIEEFCTDIANNLELWAAKNKVVKYRTKNYLYHFSLDGKIVRMRKMHITGGFMSEDWANVSSLCDIGKEWLSKYPQNCKRVELDKL